MKAEILAARSVRQAVWSMLRSEASGGTQASRVAAMEEGDRWLAHLVALFERDRDWLSPSDRTLVAKLKELRALLDLYSRHGRAAVSSGDLAATYREVCQLLERRYHERQLAKED